jgi:cytochrome c6
MKNAIRFGMIAVAAASLAAAMSFAQAGGATYKAKCASCHGAAGTPSPAMAKAMNIKPASDPSVKSKSEAQMIAITKKGAGKMPGYTGKLTDAQIKEAVDTFRSFAK